MRRAIALVVIAFLAAAPVAAASSAMPVLDISAVLAGGLAGWYGVAAILAVAVIAIAALVYMLSSVLGNADALTWARTQIYEALLGLVMIGIFFGFYALLLTNPQPAFAAAGMLPASCQSAAENTVFSLASCDLSTFLMLSNGMFQLLYYSSYISGVVPGFKVSVNLPPTSLGTGLSTSIPSIFPRGGEEMISLAFDFLIFMMMLNELQMILLSAAPLILAMLGAIGMLAWIAGFSRRFGGAMIAFAIGLGILFPLLTSITYGFIDTAIISSFNAVPGVTAIGTAANLVYNMLTALPTVFETLFSVFFLGTIPASAGALLLQYGYIFAGLSFVPFLNFMILDAFIVDFSKSIGERVSFMELLTNLV